MCVRVVGGLGYARRSGRSLGWVAPGRCAGAGIGAVPEVCAPRVFEWWVV